MHQEPGSPLDAFTPDTAEVTAVPPSSPPATANEPEKPVTQQDLNRLRRLLWVFGLLLAVLIAPYVVERLQYASTAGKERAMYDVAREMKDEFSLNEISMASRTLANFVGPSVVNLHTHGRRGEGEGSGVIMDAEGYILTNYHVVQRVSSVQVLLSDGRRKTATVVGADPLVDLAVLKTELTDLTPAEWGDSDALDVGEMVWALGSPFGFEKTITFGIVSAKERRGIRDSYGRRKIHQEFLQTDAAVNPGNSGGPLVNADGEVVGINTAIIGQSFRGISFSIPSSIARKSYEEIRQNGWVERGYLGVQPVKTPDEVARLLGLQRDQGVYLVEVRKNTPADDAGFYVHDVILTWDGTEYSDPTLLSRAIAATPIGSEVQVEVARMQGNQPARKTLTVRVATRPPDNL
ncbi:MAG: trypsin-like peptidase domain-containing protein [Planctomycetota bacterium]